ncbi:hypothetical protein ABZ897_53510 [Nonomuraea sp. NPDC046802]|uniref:hypothetical protein n=1 Tax=Nonomuraea sp. NPDC046802 TaxID=3154919 RepID=UPI0033C36E6F
MKTLTHWAVKSGIIAAAALALMASASTPALADSPIVTASDGQCAAKWLSGPNDFRIWDKDTNDSDYCYVHYSFQSDHSPFSRISHPQDVGGYHDYHILNPQGRPVIYWKICKERQNDTDICSSWRSDLT